MPTSTIPFDPSLVLGMIIEADKIEQLQAIANLQKPVDDERDHFNALLRQKLSLDMTMRELISLDVPAKQLDALKKQIDTLTGAIVKSATKLAGLVMKVEAKIANAKTAQGQKQIGEQPQSPVDFAASQLQSLPLSADTMNMDVQYFRYDENEESSHSTANSISTFVGAKVSSWLGSETYGAQAGAAAHDASTSAVNNHNVFGTLVIVANCTSREAQVFSPLVLDPDVAADSYVVWSGDDMPVESVPAMKELALGKLSGKKEKAGMPVISGASYGSSFVGFVHFEKLEDTSSSQSSSSASSQARAEVEADLFFESISGSFGVDAQTAASVKNLLSTSNIQSHCSLITMGLIPSIKSNGVKSAVMTMGNDPKENMEQLAKIQGASDASVASLAGGGSEAKTGQSIEQMKSDYISAVVSSVGKLDEQTNQVIDLNSLMVALDDYVMKAGDGKTGVPINYYVKYVSKKDIAKAWMEKYYPDRLHDQGTATGK